MSLWEIENKQKPLNLNTVTNTLIVGAGITGLTLNYLLDNEDVIIIDDKIGQTTLRSTGKITYLQDSLITIKKKKEYLESQKEAVNLLTNIIKENNIKYSLKKSPSILFTNDAKEVKKLEKLNKLLNTKENYPYNSLYNIYVEDTYVFNPGEYLKKLVSLSNNRFYKNRYVSHKYKKGYYYVTLDNNKIIKTKNLVFTTNYLPFKIKFLSVLKFRLEKSYLHAFKNETDVYNAINTKKPYCSERYYKDYKIKLINSHVLGFELDNEKMFENSSIRWSNCDLMSFDSMPYIGKFGKNIYIATSFNTWGMTNGTLGAHIIKDQIQGIENKYEKLFNPKRYTCLIYMSKNALINSYLFLKSKIIKNFKFYDNVFVYKNKYGVYIDKDGKEHIVDIKCPHLKCNLVFNEVEKTWDCPCHASRFDIDGNIIRGPATRKCKD